MTHGVREYQSKSPWRVVTIAIALAVALIAAWLVRGHLAVGRAEGAASPVPAAAQNGSQDPLDLSRHASVPHTQNADSQASARAGSAASAGPISKLDKELLVKVRQANLWELQAGSLAQENSQSEPVKRAGLHLLDGHSRLDQIVREISAALGLPIPDQPSAEQQEWVRQLRESQGAEFDRFFANQLRIAHGKVFVVVAQVRSTTQNSVIRDLAIEANIAVSDHLQVLEDTGLVEERTFEEVAAAVVP